MTAQNFKNTPPSAPLLVIAPRGAGIAHFGKSCCTVYIYTLQDLFSLALQFASNCSRT